MYDLLMTSLSSWKKKSDYSKAQFGKTNRKYALRKALI
jgi:hypothetical protein